MSGEISKKSSILLPASSVTVFTKDRETVAALKEVATDWRFARVKISGQGGDVNTAIETYKSQESPDLIIVQTDIIDDAFTGGLGDLAANCREDTAAIVIGPDNDVYLYRRLIEMGVSDYLVRPVTQDVLSEVISGTLVEKFGMSESHLICFIGAKGGVGASTMAEAALSGICNMMGEKALLLNASGGWSTLSVGMGIEPTTTLAEAARAVASDNQDALSRMIVSPDGHMAVLASGGESMLDPPVSAEQFESIVDALMVQYPVVLVDVSQSQMDIRKMMIERSHLVIVVSTAILSSLRLARSLLHEIRELRGGTAEALALLINMQGAGGAEEVPHQDIAKALDFAPSSAVPFLPRLFLGCANENRRLADSKDGQAIISGSILPLLQGLFSGRTTATEQLAPAKSGKSKMFEGFFNKFGVK